MSSNESILFVSVLSTRAGGGQTYLARILERLPEDYPLRVELLAPEDFRVADHPRLRRLPAGAGKADFRRRGF